MLNFKEPKSIEHFISNIEKLYNKNDEFIDKDLKEAIQLFKELEQQEKEINQIVVQKRSDFKEALRYIPLSVDSSIKIYIVTKIIQTDQEKIVQIDLLGKHVLNEQFNNSFLQELSYAEQMFGFETFPNLVKRIELVSTVDHFFEQNILIDGKMLNDYRKSNFMNNKNGFRIQGKIQDIFNCLDSDFVLRVWLKKQVENFKLPENLKNFMKKEVASRREILEQIWKHIKKKNLLKKGIVNLDQTLLPIFGDYINQNEQKFIALNEIGSSLREYCTKEEKLEFNIKLSGQKSVLDIYEILYKLPLDETRECMAFFAEKMIYDDKIIQHEVNKRKNTNKINLNYIKKEIESKKLEEQIQKNFQKVQKYLIKRQNYNKFANDIQQFLVDFMEIQNQNLESIRSHSSNFLQKKNYGDPNDFMNHLIKNYDDLIEREIKRIIKPS